ncbi:RNA polymerase sigma factor [Sandaracinus amylolyticus]|uniref:RNA polymerase sigma factor RpoE n=1 Tax=Sandaracinus amylolyticus TaxID=927083 RepID=A0A0F6YKQ1_9BACT|nr:sigma-70 family RNA polymerase sigma factor [Sandaracinus amylolyticus]AKF09038.1 RNA polymerase sigma factor RpoE [Sandaracinus amylolyticus]
MTSRRTPQHAVATRRAEPADDDAELVARALEGDAWAEAAIYRRHAPRVANLALRLLGRREDAMDVLQDVFVDAYTQLSALRDPAALGRWLARMTVHQAHRRFRRRRLARMLGLDRGEDATLDTLASPDVSPEQRAELARVSEALATMPPRRRFAWTLHRVEGESLPAVAESLGCSLATVKREIAAAEERVRARLGAGHEEGT